MDYIRELSSLKEKISISENLTIIILESLQKDKLFLDINYMNGKFTINKTFLNNYDGNQELYGTIEQFNTEQKVRDHFKI